MKGTRVWECRSAKSSQLRRFSCSLYIFFQKTFSTWIKKNKSENAFKFEHFHRRGQGLWMKVVAWSIIFLLFSSCIVIAVICWKCELTTWIFKVPLNIRAKWGLWSEHSHYIFTFVNCFLRVSFSYREILVFNCYRFLNTHNPYCICLYMCTMKVEFSFEIFIRLLSSHSSSIFLIWYVQFVCVCHCDKIGFGFSNVPNERAWMKWDKRHTKWDERNFFISRISNFSYPKFDSWVCWEDDDVWVECCWMFEFDTTNLIKNTRIYWKVEELPIDFISSWCDSYTYIYHWHDQILCYMYKCYEWLKWQSKKWRFHISVKWKIRNSQSHKYSKLEFWANENSFGIRWMNFLREIKTNILLNFVAFGKE